MDGGDETAFSIFHEALRLEVDRRSVAAVHVKRHGLMRMNDQPFAVDLAQADGRAHPDVCFLAVRPRPADPIQAAAEGDVVARRDAEVADLVADCTPECGEPRLQALLKRL